MSLPAVMRFYPIQSLMVCRYHLDDLDHIAVQVAVTAMRLHSVTTSTSRVTNGNMMPVHIMLEHTVMITRCY